MTIQDYANTANVQVYGDAATSSEQVKFGFTSLKLDGLGDYVETGISSKFDLSDDLTIEGWIYPTTLSGNNVIASLTADGVNFGINTSGGNSYLTAYHGATTLTQSSGTQVTTGAWQFVSFSRASNNLVISLDGVSVAEGTFTTSGLSGNALRVGSGPLDSTGFAGFMDEVRVTKGNARYSSTTYNVPDSAFPRPSSGNETITIEVWGAGGGGRTAPSGQYGGGGGYATAQYEVAPGTTLNIMVGSGGLGYPGTTRLTGENEFGGGAGSGQGGALTGVFTASTSSPIDVDTLHAATLVIGGSGGGNGTYSPTTGGGGQGGGTTGGDGLAPESGEGGTQSVGGARASDNGGRAGEKLKGGASQSGASNNPRLSGAGGAGYYGGGGGGSTSPSNTGDGGGGSGYFEDSSSNLPANFTYVPGSGILSGGLNGGNASAHLRAGPSGTPTGPSIPDAYGTGGNYTTAGGADIQEGRPGYVRIVRGDGTVTDYTSDDTLVIP